MNDSAGSTAEYRVLARTYRPQTLDDLIGQDALVRTLRNALEQGRVAHAFVLTGVRGVGKTTTARIIARGLNCLGPDGNGGPTVNPCGVCANCRAITEDRHVDVLEMDAASRTGVDDIRDIIEGVQYRPVSARYKIYIIDEVHMLSRNAFNALLKTLEEPPEHVKFVFATTEIRKVPITVLSRCQRFDLRRIDVADLSGLFERICGLESVEAEPEALRLIATAADGSARDGLSLLDQAMALARGPVTAGLVQDMLGLADRAEIFTLFSGLMAGRITEVLAQVRAMHNLGTDPLVITQDLLDAIHLVTRFKVTPAEAALEASQVEREHCEPLANGLAMPHLGRAWQMMLKGVEEIQSAPVPLAALEMLLIRLVHLADTPPGTAPRRGDSRTSTGAASPTPRARPAETGSADEPVEAGTAAAPRDRQAGSGPADEPVEPEAAIAAGEPETPAGADSPAEEPGLPQTLDEIVDLFEQNREAVIVARLRRHARPVRVEPGTVELAAVADIDSDLAAQMMRHLANWTGRSWSVILNTDAQGGPTIVERERDEARAKLEAVTADPTVAAVLREFPGATVREVRDRTSGETAT